MDVTAYIVAGGKSSRMGEDKALTDFAGTQLLPRMISLVSSITANVKIAANCEKYATYAPIVSDIFPGCGPLAGIHAALRNSQTELNLILAVDMPFIEAGFLSYMLEQASSTVALVTVPRAHERYQPLCAVYRRAFADPAETALVMGHNKIDPLFTPEVTHVITQDEIERLAFPLAMFDNLNTREDLARARARNIHE